MYTGKIVVIGAGFVGSTTAYTLMLSGMFSEIAIIDINKNKAQGDAMDMNHGVSFVRPLRVVEGDYSECKNADIIVITAGVSQKPGESRVDLLIRNNAVFTDIVGNILKYCKSSAILLVVTNPVDILTYVTYKLSGFPKEQVIGSGTVLDTSRLKYLISEHVGIDVRDINTYIIGEHGDTEVAAWSLTNIAGMELPMYCEKCGKCGGMNIIDMHNEVKSAAYDIIAKKGSTYYAVALAVRRIIEAIVRDEHSILTVSSVFEGEYGINNICLSLPSVVGKVGVERILQIDLSDEEKKGLLNSAQTLSALVKEIGF